MKLANEVEFHDDYNPNIAIPQPKPRKKTDVQKELILEPREIRPKKTIDYKALNSKGN